MTFHRMKMPLIDTHCHVQAEAFDADRAETLERARLSLEACIIVGDDLDASHRAIALCGPGIYAITGVHPYHAALLWSGTPTTESAAARDALRSLALSPGVVGIGETGLDYFRYCATPKAIQRQAFIIQLELARELNLPVVIHNRDAHEDVSAILDEYAPLPAGGVMHCFAGGPAFVERTLGWGLHISFAGNVTFPKAQELREAAQAVPVEHLLIETDSPYLAPQPVRGKRCEPAYLHYTLESLAETRGETVEELARHTSENARRLFRLPA